MEVQLTIIVLGNPNLEFATGWHSLEAISSEETLIESVEDFNNAFERLIKDSSVLTHELANGFRITLPEGVVQRSVFKTAFREVPNESNQD